MFDWLYPYYSGAGRGAREKYRRASKHWRRRVFRRMRWVFAGVALALLAAARADHFNLASWLLGVALGGLLAVYMALRDLPPPYIENWRTGLEGEQRTAKALAPLRRRGYELLHDLPDRRTREHGPNGNIDHVVVSTGGVFLLDSKYLGGEVSVEGDYLHIQRRDDEEASYSCQVGRTIRGRAVRLKQDIGETGVGYVQAVVVYWNSLPATDPIVGDQVVYLHGERLAGWLEEQEPTISSGIVSSVTAAIARARPRENQTRWERLAAFTVRRRGVAVESRSTAQHAR